MHGTEVTGNKHPLNLRKLSVGSHKIADLQNWQNHLAAKSGGRVWHTTRAWPRRAEEILGGGSIYWIIKGEMQVRQRILGFEEYSHSDYGNKTACRILLDPLLIKTYKRPHRPFQGWRYLVGDEAPDDLEKNSPLPESLENELRQLGIF